MRKRTLGVVLLAGLAMSGAGAFTNTNDVDASTAGVGSDVVSGVTVTDIDYTTSTSVSGVDQIASVAFTAGEVMTGKKMIVRLKGATTVLQTADNLGEVGQLNTCAVGTVATTRVTCSFAVTSRADLVAVQNLEVVVYDND